MLKFIGITAILLSVSINGERRRCFIADCHNFCYV